MSTNLSDHSFPVPCEDGWYLNIMASEVMIAWLAMAELYDNYKPDQFRKDLIIDPVDDLGAGKSVQG